MRRTREEAGYFGVPFSRAADRDRWAVIRITPSAMSKIPAST